MAAQSDIDESLYSRQLYVMGHEAQRRMAGSSVLICGLNGLGVETAKNVILAGVKSVTLHDETPASWADLSSQFYLEEGDLGKPRAAVSAPKLAELNPYVTVSVMHGELNKAALSQFSAVVLIDLPSRARQLEIADYCHSIGVCVMVGDTHGVFGTVFCDFGDAFVCADTTGELCASSLVSSIVDAGEGKLLVTVDETTPHGLESGDKVAITEVTGLGPSVNAEFIVKCNDRYAFEIPLTGATGRYEKGGYVNQIKQPVTLSFDTMSTSLASPGAIIGDAFKMEYAAVLHLAFQALYAFRDQHGEMPLPGNAQHAAAVFQLTRGLVGPTTADLETVDKFERVVTSLALGSRGQVGPICALVGGVLGQEVLKAVSGKFMPTRQWFYFDAVEMLPEPEALCPENLSPMGCRYDGQIMALGRSLQGMLGGLRIFVVGAGAIGCEMLKNFALMGVGCADSCADRFGGHGATAAGSVVCTDMDQIEKSNLSRQFLFRSTDINHPKSTTAVRAVKRMNAAFQGTAYENKVGPETEAIFNDDFFDSLTCIFTALDNIDARLYVDQKAMFYRKPMLDSGTLGTKGSTQVVIPGKTENYGARRDPPEQSIAICTLKYYPNAIEHTIAWARDWFEEVYKQTPEDINKYTAGPEAFLEALASQANVKFDTLRRMRDGMVTSRPSSFADCLSYARLQFEDIFANKIKQLLHNFPHDKMMAGPGGVATPFWQPPKKPAPAPLQFDVADETHYEFVCTVARLWAQRYGVAVVDYSPADVASVLASVSVPAFSPADGLTIPSNDEEAKAGGGSSSSSSSSSGGGSSGGGGGAGSTLQDIDETCAQLVASLPHPSSITTPPLRSIDFDKDVDDQMRVVAAVSNLRARNYSIREVDLHKARGIAGKIMPAIATTTALATGLICLELFKVLQDKPVEKYMNSFSNLALPLFVCQEPDKPAGIKSVIKGKEYMWTVWDRIDISEPSMTLAQLIAHLAGEYGVELSMLSSGVTILFSDFMDRKKSQERQSMTLRQIVETVTKRSIPPSQRFMTLEVICQDPESGDEVEMPVLRFRL